MSATYEQFESTSFRWLAGEFGDEQRIEQPRELRDVLLRYREHANFVLGLDEFAGALETLMRFSQDLVSDAPSPDSILAAKAALDGFIENTQRIAYASQSTVPRVFVSHRQRTADMLYAERIACIAEQWGFRYWLDLHDPLLASLARTPLPLPIHAVVTALIIELALMNCSHVIAVVTPNAAGSLWIPYEYGRAKARKIVSSQSAAWLHPQMTGAPLAEYLLLGELLPGERFVNGWLQNEAQRIFGTAVRRPHACTAHTSALP